MEVSLLHDPYAEAHAALVDQAEAMSALLHALREEVPSKVRCRGQGGRVANGARHATEGGQGTRVSAQWRCSEREGGRAKAEAGRASWRTAMLVTRDVSQALSGWLKADAP